MARITLRDLSPACRQRIADEFGVSLRSRSARFRASADSQSPYADRLWCALQERFSGRVVREYRPLEERRFRLDFAFPDDLLAIEFDGYRHHGFSREGFAKGLARQNLLVIHGWRFLRYTLRDVRDDLDGVLVQVEMALSARSQNGANFFAIEQDCGESDNMPKNQWETTLGGVLR